MVDDLLQRGEQVLSIDIRQPQNQAHEDIFKKVDILDYPALEKTFCEFRPEHVVHLAARTDLNEKNNIEGYAANIEGVENMVDALASQHSVQRAIFASTKLICPSGHSPNSDDEYCPDTLYGESKVRGEKIVRQAAERINCVWSIIRPTSIWGPWFDIPYRGFFLSVAKGWYMHPGRIDPPRSFGYVGNTVFQLRRILEIQPQEADQKVFYVSDYKEYRTLQWANLISMRTRKRKVRIAPHFLVLCAARVGDVLKRFGMKNPPLTTFRLKNMSLDTTHLPMEPTIRIAQELPYSLEQGVDSTIEWMKNQRMI